MNELKKVEHSANSLVAVERYCEITPTSLRFKRGVIKEEWENVFNSLALLDKCVHWWIGDSLAYKKREWGMYKELAKKTGYDEDTLRKDKTVAEKIESGIRRPLLSFSYHIEVAKFTPEEQEKWLDKAEREKLTSKELRKLIKEEKYKEQPPIIANANN